MNTNKKKQIKYDIWNIWISFLLIYLFVEMGKKMRQARSMCDCLLLMDKRQTSTSNTYQCQYVEQYLSKEHNFPDFHR